MNKEFELTTAAVEAHWPLHNVRFGKILQQSGERITAEFTADQGRFVYKIADPIKTLAAMEKDTAVFDLLVQRNFSHVPKLLATKDRRNFKQIGSKFVYVMEFIAGAKPPETPETFAKLAGIMAELHGIKDYPYQTDFKASAVIPDLLANSAQYSFGAEYSELLQRLPNFDNFPQALIHTDINPGNSVQRPDSSIVLVDWDDAGIGTRVLDLGAVAGNLFISEDRIYKQENAAAFFHAYLAKQTLTAAEIEHIFDAALFFACMYIIYGAGPEVRWQRIKEALANRSSYEAVYKKRLKSPGSFAAFLL